MVIRMMTILILVTRILILMSYYPPLAMLGSILTILKTMMMIVVMIETKKAILLSYYPRPAVLGPMLTDYSNVGLGSSLRGEPGLTTFRSQGCP